MLDSFRFLAIFFVLLYHYTFRYSPTPSYPGLYPYKDFYGSIFQYGFLGVHFFFIISGFVISYTLENTQTLKAFIRNRFIRLFPPALVWTTLTYLVFVVLDNEQILPESHQLKNFLPSLSFIDPRIWTGLLHIQFNWINGSYWSLWVEVQFYLFCSVLFFADRKRFFSNILFATVAITFANYLPARFSSGVSGIAIREHHPGLASFLDGWNSINEMFSLTRKICFFSIGVIFYQLYKKVRIEPFSRQFWCSLFVFAYPWFYMNATAPRLIYLLMIALFVLMIYKKKAIAFLENRLFMRIGVISYSLYLAHEHIGNLLIHSYGGYLGKWSPFCVPLVMILMIVLAELSHRFIEYRLSRALRSIGGGKARPVADAPDFSGGQLSTLIVLPGQPPDEPIEKTSQHK